MPTSHFFLFCFFFFNIIFFPFFFPRPLLRPYQLFLLLSHCMPTMRVLVGAEVAFLFLFIAGVQVVADFVHCPPNYDCGTLQLEKSDKVECYPGFYCPTNTYIKDCPAGSYCPDMAMTDKKDCPEGKFCPKLTSEPRDCSFWSVCPKGSERQLDWLLPVIALAFGVVSYVLYRAYIHVRDKRRETREHKAGFYQKFTGKTSDLVHVETAVNFEFKNLGVTITKRRFCGLMKSKESISILSDVSGCIYGGKVTAIMGPSGAGKTTFLNALCGKIERTSGAVYINGLEEPLAKYRREIGYVPQDDIMLRDLSVKEILLHSARVRLGHSVSPEEIARRVNITLDVLGLTEIRHMPIGDEFRRGISGGQRKRVNVGMELVTAPSVLFLDEPTSGLDSTQAESVMASMKNIAACGLTVVAVVHQPRQEIFEMIDDILLLGRGGVTVYQGPIQEMKAYFESLGFDFPRGTTVPDRVMDLLAGKGGQSEVVDFPAKWVEKKQLDAEKEKEKEKEKGAAVGAGAMASAGVIAVRDPAGFFFQLWSFIRRGMVQMVRSYQTHIINTLMHFLAGVIFGIPFLSGRIFVKPVPLIYAEADYCPKAVRDAFCYSPLYDLTGYLCQFVIMAVSAVAIATSVRSFGMEKVVFWREASAGINKQAYYLAKNIVDLIFIFTYAFSFTCGLLGVASLAGSFGNYLLLVLVTEFAVYALGYILSIISTVPNATLVGVVSTLVWASVANGMTYSVKKMGFWGFISYPRWVSEGIFYAEVWSQMKSSADKAVVKYYLDNLQYGFKMDHFFLDWFYPIVHGVVFRFIGAAIVQVANAEKRR
eukprot:TRINITY_DN598_c0_g2_i3.p1 TRINITY_DN598_c0_g2~~TRINITY_DN598_c0_g2_i3.p1  ORF type:complete len:820 (+),score=195.49 TRINITY_DN598_c0_g2_i3:24-2483(+)